MKRNIILLGVIAFAIFVASDLFAQDNTSVNDSVAITLRLNKLQAKRDKLQNEIKVEDAKRNRRMNGVAPQTLEEINDRQDSLCLALRSELIDVILEIKEISPSVSSPELMQQYNNLVNRLSQASLNAGEEDGQAAIGKPTKNTTIQPSKKPKS